MGGGTSFTEIGLGQGPGLNIYGHARIRGARTDARTQPRRWTTDFLPEAHKTTGTTSFWGAVIPPVISSLRGPPVGVCSNVKIPS